MVHEKSVAGFGQTDKTRRAIGLKAEFRFPRRRVQENRRTRRSCDHCRQTASVVVMAVAQDDGVEPVQANAELAGVFDQQIRLPGIEQDLMRSELNVPGQSVFGLEAALVDRIFHQNGDADFLAHAGFMNLPVALALTVPPCESLACN